MKAKDNAQSVNVPTGVFLMNLDTSPNIIIVGDAGIGRKFILSVEQTEKGEILCQ